MTDHPLPTKEQTMQKQLKILAALLTVVGAGFVAKHLYAHYTES